MYGCITYVNIVRAISYVYVDHFPELLENQVFQLRADVNRHIIPLDILEVSDNVLVEITYKQEMESLIIAIEP